MNTQFTNQQKPTLIHVIAWMTLVSGIVNLIWGLAASGTVLATVVGIVCIPIAILPTILGIFEIIYAAKLMSTPPQPVQPSTNIAVLEIVCIVVGNVFSVVVGVLALVFYNDIAVKEYFAKINGTLTTDTQVAPVVPAFVPDPAPAPVEPAESTPADEAHSPGSEEAPKG
ncbi:MAG TPA: hypothetical protein VMN99_11840 [Anaerolineales bacterium]|nr:hypothetical protein [Anaerolineales bacterium]